VVVSGAALTWVVLFGICKWMPNVVAADVLDAEGGSVVSTINDVASLAMHVVRDASFFQSLCSVSVVLFNDRRQQAESSISISTSSLSL
jgi:hypothetical protein